MALTGDMKMCVFPWHSHSWVTCMEDTWGRAPLTQVFYLSWLRSSVWVNESSLPVSESACLLFSWRWKPCEISFRLGKQQGIPVMRQGRANVCFCRGRGDKVESGTCQFLTGRKKPIIIGKSMGILSYFLWHREDRKTKGVLRHKFLALRRAMSGWGRETSKLREIILFTA